MEYKSYPSDKSLFKSSASSMTEPSTAKIRNQQLISYLAEGAEAQPWSGLRQLPHRLSPITSIQGGKRNNETAGDFDTMGRVLDSACRDLSYLDERDEERDEERYKPSQENWTASLNYPGSWFDNTASLNYLGSCFDDTRNLPSLARSLSPVSHAVERSKLDRHPAALELPPVLPDAGAEVSPTVSFTSARQIADVERLRQNATAFFDTLSRYARSGHIPGATKCSPSPADNTPTNQATASGKTTCSSKKRLSHSKQKSRAKGNIKKGDGESEGDDDHRDIRQKTTHEPLKDVNLRAFACPFFKLYPQIHRRTCDKTQYPPTSSGAYSLQVCT
jgi:hypothetical protein